jgi:hypothetical protein
MDAEHFDRLSRVLARTPSRRRAVGVMAAALIWSSLGLGHADAKKKKKRSCGLCRRRRKGRCKPAPDGTGCGGAKICRGGACLCPTPCCATADCGACQVCQGGQCVSTCQGGTICQEGRCVCPVGKKACGGTCIPETECCGACPQGQTCCNTVGLCKDLLNDPAFCGQCANGQCPGGADCANGECGLSCTIGQACFTGCTCGTRADPAHLTQTVCAAVTCATATACASDTACGFRKVCVSGLCPPFNVCAAPCA